MTIDITYRGPGPWGPGIDEDLTETQVDTNFWNLVQAVLEKAVQGVGISNFVVSGGQFTVLLTDHTLLGPYPLPIAQIGFKGEWIAEFEYLTNEIFTHVGVTYIVLTNHTSEATFDPGANDGEGNDYYGVLLENPALVIPPGGATGAFLRKVTGTDYDIYWDDDLLLGSDLADVSVGTPVEGQVLTYLSGVWTGAPSVTSLEDLTDVSLTTLVADQALRWDGIAWTNVDDPLAALTLADLTDVQIDVDVALQGNDLLQYHNEDSIWKNVTTRMVSGSSSGTVSLDPSASFNIGYTLSASVTFNATKVISGHHLLLLLRSNGGKRTVTFGTNFRSKGTMDIQATPAAILFVGEGTNTGAGSDKYCEVARTFERRGIEVVDPGIGQIKNDLADVFSLTPNADIFFTLNFSPGPTSQEITFIITTSGTTSYNITFDTPFINTGTLATGTVSGKKFVMKFISNGTDYIEVSRTVAM